MTPVSTMDDFTNVWCAGRFEAGAFTFCQPGRCSGDCTCCLRRPRRGTVWRKRVRPFVGELVTVTSVQRGAVHFDMGAGRAWRELQDFLACYEPAPVQP